ncbi:YesL family protein [Microbacterium sp. M]|uniref:YesL family protein n=1 Tax=Microbacterium sp. M TaxID=3377125 RepID=UPI00386B565F
MFSFEGFMRINLFLRGVYRIAFLNVLWIAATVLGLVVFGIGPASYAVAAYIDRWFRFGETPPVTRAFIGHFRTHYWRSAAMGWILTAAAAIVITNIFAASTWLLQFGNVVALVVIGIIAAYVFPVMAATDVRGIPRQIAAALMLGIGSLHWTIVAAAAVAATVWLLTSFALPLLVMFGIGIPAAAIGFVTRIVFGQLAADAAATATQTSPPRARVTAQARLHLARGTSE